MSAIQNQFLRLSISKNRKVNKFERQIYLRNTAQLLPSKKPSTNARAQISNLQVKVQNHWEDLLLQSLQEGK